jgi:hypothetical protein
MPESQRDAWYRSVTTDEDERIARSFYVASYGCCLLLLILFVAFALGIAGLGWSMLGT